MSLPPSLDLAEVENHTAISQILDTHRVLAVSMQLHPDGIYNALDALIPTAADSTHISENLTLSLLMVLVPKQDPSKHTILQPVHCTYFNLSARDLLTSLLKLDIRYVGYGMVTDICWLRHLNLPIPEHIWDVRTAQRFLSLGEINAKARTQNIGGLPEQIESKQTYQHLALKRLEMHSIAGQCGLQIGIQPPTLVQLRIYQAQKQKMENRGCKVHFSQVEMQWQRTVADLQYNGVRIDTELHETLLKHALHDRVWVKQRLQEFGISNPESRDSVWQAFQTLGLDRLFYTDSSHTRFSLKDDQLECHQDKHSVIGLLRRYRKVRNIISVQKTVARELTSKNTIHPVHVQLGTETGRQTCHNPNLLGFDRIQRNIVIPDPGCGIAEVDFSAHEVGIAAGLYRDQNLINLYNAGDVYTKMAQSFYAGRPEIEVNADNWPEDIFRKKYPHLRANLKTVTLAILYGQGAYGLAQRLAISEEEARAFLGAFSSMFPVLEKRMVDAVNRAMQTGYVELINGVRIALDSDPAIHPSVLRRHARNYPIQGSGAIIFKTAGVLLKEVYPRYGARLLVPMHDAFIFQAPLNTLDDVVEVTAKHMINTMKMYFPDLEPKVSRNYRHPECWVKDGYEGALIDYLNETKPMVT